jgi:peptidoglycan/LPS O-acetylase OafA/YrhL
METRTEIMTLSDSTSNPYKTPEATSQPSVSPRSGKVSLPRHDNNIDELRLALAMGVVLYHAWGLSREPALEWFKGAFLGDRFVQAFFVLSGYLIPASWASAPSWQDYTKRRLGRLLPAYVLVVGVCFAIGWLFSSFNIVEFMQRGGARYLGANLTFMNFLGPELPGVFQSNEIRAVNGSLWTLKVELAYYLAVPLIVACHRRFGVFKTAIALVAISFAYRGALRLFIGDEDSKLADTLARQLPGQLMFFAGGHCLREIVPKMRSMPVWTRILLAVVSLAGLIAFDGILLGRLVFVTTLLAALIEMPVPVRNVLRGNDISFGVYLFHFPLIQTLVAYGWFANSPWGSLAATLVILVALAYCSWIWVEKPAILASRTRRAPERAPDYIPLESAEAATR